MWHLVIEGILMNYQLSDCDSQGEYHLKCIHFMFCWLQCNCFMPYCCFLWFIFSVNSSMCLVWKSVIVMTETVYVTFI